MRRPACSRGRRSRVPDLADFRVLGLAYTFGLGRGQVDRYEIARAALGTAENRLERLLLLAERTPASDSLAVGYRSPAFPFEHSGIARGTQWWHVDPYDDPNVPGSVDLRRIVVCVRWNASVPDSVQPGTLLPVSVQAAGFSSQIVLLPVGVPASVPFRRLPPPLRTPPLTRRTK